MVIPVVVLEMSLCVRARQFAAESVNRSSSPSTENGRAPDRSAIEADKGLVLNDDDALCAIATESTGRGRRVGVSTTASA